MRNKSESGFGGVVRRANQGGSSTDRGYASWHGTAFLVEAVLILLMATVSLGIMVSMLARANVMGTTASQESYAATLASTGARNGAEAFAADPTGVDKTTYYEVKDGVISETDQYLHGSYAVSCEVTPEKKAGGTLYRAVITVKCSNKTICQISTAKYVSKGRG